VRQVLAGATALVVAVLTGSAAAAAPAVALTTYLTDVTVAPGSEGAYASLLGSFARSQASAQIRRVAYKVDYCRSAGNNTAKLQVTLPQDAAGSLPITGTGLGVGAVLIVNIGAGVLVLARRRRLRFTS
jgi:hypothetical protein